jgi:tRNA threonylcarbamoyladenosine biosynthesis protein TsaE
MNTQTQPATLEVVTAEPAATQALAARLAPLLRPGDVLLLGGDLGAGKTTFTRGLARALGVNEAVTSPTFTLMHSYPTSGALSLLHADMYRLERIREVEDLGLAELLEEPVLAVIEWGERAAPVLPPDYLEIRFDLTNTEGERRISFRPLGPSWAARRDALHEVVAP